MMMTGAGDLRRIGPEACELLADLRRGSTKATPWRAEDFRTLLSQPAVKCFLLIDQDEDGIEGPVGYSLFSCTGDEAEIYDLVVLPEFRGAGRGKLLLLAAIVTARSHGARSIHLEVDETNEAARSLYSRTGFRMVGRRRGYYRDEDGKVTDALTMRLDLE